MSERVREDQELESVDTDTENHRQTRACSFRYRILNMTRDLRSPVAAVVTGLPVVLGPSCYHRVITTQPLPISAP
jgi:hypothetical protein